MSTIRSRVNPLLAETIKPLPAGTALDLGCGAGGDTIWLAQHGWHVVAVDISTTTVEQVLETARAPPDQVVRPRPSPTTSSLSGESQSRSLT